MNNQGLNIIRTNIQKEIDFLTPKAKYNRGRMFARAKYIYNNSVCTWSDAVTQSWDESKKSMVKTRLKLTAAKERLMDLTKPEQLHETESYKLQNDKNAYENGCNLNQIKI